MEGSVFLWKGASTTTTKHINNIIDNTGSNNVCVAPARMSCICWYGTASDMLVQFKTKVPIVYRWDPGTFHALAITPCQIVWLFLCHYQPRHRGRVGMSNEFLSVSLTGFAYSFHTFRVDFYYSSHLHTKLAYKYIFNRFQLFLFRMRREKDNQYYTIIINGN